MFSLCAFFFLVYLIMAGLSAYESRCAHGIPPNRPFRHSPDSRPVL
jgi:hypothetical protein